MVQGFEWGEYSGLFGGPNIITRVHIKVKGGGRRARVQKGVQWWKQRLK